MAGQYDVSMGAMAQSQQRMDAGVADIRAELTQLRGRLDAVQGQWLGDGNVAFTEAHARYEMANTRLNQALDQMSGAVRQAHTGYGVTDEDAGSGLRASGAGMDVRVPGL